MAGARLERLVVLHQRFNAVGLHGPREPLSRGLDSLDGWYGHPLPREGVVNVKDLQCLFDSFLLGGVRGVALLPEKLGGAEE